MQWQQRVCNSVCGMCRHMTACWVHVQVVVEGGWRNKIAYPIIESLNIPIMRTWNQTVPMWSLHHHYNLKCGTQCDATLLSSSLHNNCLVFVSCMVQAELFLCLAYGLFKQNCLC